VLGTVVTVWRARRAGVPMSVIVDAIAHVVIAGFVVSRVFDAVVYAPEKVAADPLYLLRPKTGLSSFGGFLGALVGAWLWKLRRKQSIIAVTDHIAFAFPIGFGLGRVGCFLTHDHPGTVTSFPLAVADYRVGAPPYLPRHDLGLYEALFCAGLVALFFALGRKPRRPGLYLGLLPLLYAPFRFFLDFLRETSPNGGDVRYLGLTPGQYGAVVLGSLGAGVLAFIYRRKDPNR
jgi:phosphatidylglycerol:prolipoprotein diacylglycerol transferase